MSFHVVLPSNASTTDYPNNANNSYKVRLAKPLHLQGRWEVALESIALPDSSPKLSEVIPFTTVKMFFVQWCGGRNFYKREFPHDIVDANTPKSGVEFAKMIINSMHNVRTFDINFDKNYFKNNSWLATKAKLKYPNLKMDGDELLLDYSNVHKGQLDCVAFAFDGGLAQAMGWLTFAEDGTAQLGPNLRIHHETENSCNLDASGVVEDVQRHGTTVGLYWTFTPGKWLYLSFNASWRFVNLNAAFERMLNYRRCSLYVYSSVAQSQMVGSQLTDLLREVPYKTEGAGSQYFEPTLVQYKPVRSNDIDSIEVQVAETEGKLTDFKEGVTTTTLHFRQIG